MKGKKTGGRTKNALNKTTRTVKEAFTEAFESLQKDPATKLCNWGKDNPTEFYKLCSKLIPTAMDVKLENNIIEVIVPSKK
jgi:hypothetical protein